MMNDRLPTLEDAVSNYNFGHLDKAEKTCRALLEYDPQNADALHLLGLMAHRAGRQRDALDLVSKAVAINGNNPEYYSTLGSVLMLQGEMEESAKYLHRALKIAPGNARAHVNLGNLLRANHRLEEAVTAYRKAVEIAPDFVEALNNLASTLLIQGDFHQALDPLRHAIVLQPNAVGLHLNLGVALKLNGDLTGAIDAYTNALALQPECGEAHYNLGGALHAQGRVDEAIFAYRKAIQVKPDWAEAHNSLGVALQEQNLLDEAMQSYQKAASLRSGWHLPYHNLAKLASKQSETNRAIEMFRKAITISPGFAPSHVDLGMLLLQCGEFEEGWREYEWRWGLNGHTPAREGFDVPVWDGSPLDGRTLALWVEQGYGDTIQFVRYIPLIEKCGGKVLLQSPRRMLGLLETVNGVDRIICDQEPVDHIDVQFPLLSLPRIFGTTVTNIPWNVPYLEAPSFAHPALDAISRDRASLLKVGIVWASGEQYINHEWRDCSCGDFRAISRLPGVWLFSLQFGERAEELRDCPDLKITDLSDVIGDFSTTAAFVDKLDLIITVDTAMAHLAGALGKQVWVLLNYRADWRWMMEREDSPWYPTMRLWRQPRPGDWAEVFERVRQRLYHQLFM